MRPIKFRAWCKEDKKMFGWESVGVESYNPYLLIERSADDKLGQRNWDTDLILMQYIGLKDSQNVEIYEGDILEWTWKSDDTKKERAAVYWDEETFCAFVLGVKGTRLSQSLFSGHKYYKVIGNIYESPELL